MDGHRRLRVIGKLIIAVIAALVFFSLAYEPGDGYILRSLTGFGAKAAPNAKPSNGADTMPSLWKQNGNLLSNTEGTALLKCEDCPCDEGCVCDDSHATVDVSFPDDVEDSFGCGIPAGTHTLDLLKQDGCDESGDPKTIYYGTYLDESCNSTWEIEVLWSSSESPCWQVRVLEISGSFEGATWEADSLFSEYDLASTSLGGSTPNTVDVVEVP
ncbi:MAG: hypothetical protein WD118_01435 [Phycisphaeraceae bacterium]